MHRFSSQSWWDHVSKHFSADLTNAFDEIVRLKVCSISVEPQCLNHERKSLLDRSGDRVGAGGPRNAAQTWAARLRSHAVPARPAVYVGQDSKEGDEGWGSVDSGGVSGSKYSR